MILDNFAELEDIKARDAEFFKHEIMFSNSVGREEGRGQVRTMINVSDELTLRMSRSSKRRGTAPLTFEEPTEEIRYNSVKPEQNHKEPIKKSEKKDDDNIAS